MYGFGQIDKGCGGYTANIYSEGKFVGTIFATSKRELKNFIDKDEGNNPLLINANKDKIYFIGKPWNNIDNELYIKVD
jgi:hypothetical protein